MDTEGPLMLHQYRDRFLRQVAIHHEAGDYYPNPKVISDETGFSPHLAERVVGTLWTQHWIARSPYAVKRIRLTPHGWEQVKGLAMRIGDIPCPTFPALNKPSGRAQPDNSKAC